MALSTFGSPIPELELWRCARQQIDQMGVNRAIDDAKERVQALSAAGDQEGANTWSAITLRVLSLAGR